MFIRVSHYACTEVKDQNGEDDNVWPFTFISPTAVIDDDCILGEASAMLFDRKRPSEEIDSRSR